MSNHLTQNPMAIPSPQIPMYSSEGRRSSRPQNLHLETDLTSPNPLAAGEKLALHGKGAVDPAALINHHVSSSRSDSSRSSTCSTDESSIATPTLETATPPTFTLSPPDRATRELLRDRYLESQHPIIVGSNSSLDIPRSAYQEPKNSNTILAIFTPPETPASTKQKETLKVDQSIPPPKFLLDTQEDTPTNSENEDEDTDMGVDSNRPEDEETSILRPIGSYKLDDPTRPTRLGSGAWSNVYKGYFNAFENNGSPLVVAIKVPLNNSSIGTLQREAQILSYIHRKITKSSEYQSIIPFHGFDDSTNSIIMTALSSENLEQFTSRHRVSQASVTNFNQRKLPIVGITQWLFIAERLIGACAFLKANGVLHGDIKPQNILTKAWENHNPAKYDWISSEEATTLTEPVLADFSSAYVIDNNGYISDDDEPISAVTTIYCAPELLAAFLTPPSTPTRAQIALTSSSSNENGLVPPKKNEPRPLPTFESDLYSLCMTLLQCAIGSHPYAAARMEIQKSIWARQGDPMRFARSDDRVFRCKAGGAVDRLLDGCFGKTADGRTKMAELTVRIENLCQEWKNRKGEEQWVWGS